jgi:glucose-1-phosphate thymidylyltransferase
VIGSDNIFEGDFQELVETFLQKKNGMIVVHNQASERLVKRYGVVENDSSKRIISFDEKPISPRSTLASTLCYLFTDKEIRLLKRYIRENPSEDKAGVFIKYIKLAQEPVSALEG